MLPSSVRSSSGNCQAQPSWLALISVYYRRPTTRNSLKMANLAYIESRMDLDIPILTSINQLQLGQACLSLAQLCPSLFFTLLTPCQILELCQILEHLKYWIHVKYWSTSNIGSSSNYFLVLLELPPIMEVSPLLEVTPIKLRNNLSHSLLPENKFQN